MTEKIYTVLELNQAVSDAVKREFPGYIWVCGEIQGLRPERDKKHTYFELVQKHPQDHEIVAKARIALFANRKPLVFERIRKAQQAFELKNDIEVKFLCQVSLHPPTGQYSLIVIDIDPIYTLGKFAQNRLKIIEELRREGLLEKNKLLKIPEVPLKIGLITAFDSAAYHDFINELNSSGYGFKIIAYNSYMQGKNVERDVLQGLEYLSSPDLKLDTVIITRGGGSKADLAWFDNKRIAAKIALMKIPILSALGHQTDESVTDLVSNTSFKTPTKVAQFLVEKVTQLLNNLESLNQAIIEKSALYLDFQKQALKTSALTVDHHVNRYLREKRVYLGQAQSTTVSFVNHVLKNKNNLMRENLKIIADAVKRTLQDARSNVKYIESKISILDPGNVLKRGYSITLKADKPVKSAAQLKKGEILKTIYYKGESLSQIKEVRENDQKNIQIPRSHRPT
ncbi:MAG: exodeoxyribonuclease VII large subunit [Candidatus Omnitrophica bacterium]|nr:exodeoxyribonuclease VII large subunit [Candidatus Omnitrophota bacterium]